MDTEDSLVKQLRDAAMKCTNIDYRALMRGVAEEVFDACDAFDSDRTSANLIALNGMWAYGERVLANAPDEAPPAPLAGSPEPARLAA